MTGQIVAHHLLPHVALGSRPALVTSNVFPARTVRTQSVDESWRPMESTLSAVADPIVELTTDVSASSLSLYLIQTLCVTQIRDPESSTCWRWVSAWSTRVVSGGTGIFSRQPWTWGGKHLPLSLSSLIRVRFLYFVGIENEYVHDDFINWYYGKCQIVIESFFNRSLHYILENTVIGYKKFNDFPSHTKLFTWTVSGITNHIDSKFLVSKLPSRNNIVSRCIYVLIEASAERRCHEVYWKMFINWLIDTD